MKRYYVVWAGLIYTVINQKVQMGIVGRDEEARRVPVQVFYQKYYRDIGERRFPVQVFYQKYRVFKEGCYDYEARRFSAQMFYQKYYREIGERRVPAQMLYDYQYGVISTCFNGKEIPEWITHRRKGPSISFTCQSSLTIRGLNVCFLCTLSGMMNMFGCLIYIRNLTKDITWHYFPHAYGVGGAKEEGMVWLSHWMFGNNEFEDGDEVSLTIEDLCDGEDIKECGISLVSHQHRTHASIF